MPSALGRPLLGVVKVHHIEHIGKTVCLDRAAISHLVSLDVVDGSTQIGHKAPVLPESLVHIEHDVGVGLRVKASCLGIVTVLSSLRDGGLGRRIILLRIEVVSIVYAYTSCDIEPVKDVVTCIQRQHITFLVVVAEITVVDPVRVLHTQVSRKVIAPELFHQFRSRIVSLEAPVKVEVLATREKICRCKRVCIHTLIGHVLVLLDNVACTGIKTELVIEEVCRVPECKVITVIQVVRYDSVRIDCRSREICLVLVCSAGNGKGISIGMTCLEVVLRSVTAALSHLRAPAVDAGPAVLAVQTCSIPVLELWQTERIEKLRIAGECHFKPSCLTFLSCDHHCSVCRLRAIEGCRCRTGQHRDGLNVFRVDVCDGLGGSLRVELCATASSEVIHRHAVDDIKCVGTLAYGFVTTENDL